MNGHSVEVIYVPYSPSFRVTTTRIDVKLLVNQTNYRCYILTTISPTYEANATNKDHVKTERIEIRHCPTLQMLANFFTKPLQGSLFRKFHDVVLGYKHFSALTLPTPISTEERVEDQTETDVANESIKEKEESEDTGMTNEARAAVIVDHEKANDDISGDERWFRVTGKRKAKRFQDMSDIATAH